MVVKAKKKAKSDLTSFYNFYKPGESPGKIWAIIGPPFSGKSHILCELAGLIPPAKTNAADLRNGGKNMVRGYLPPEPPFFRGSSLKKEIDYITRIRKNEDSDFLKELLQAFQLEGAFELPFKKASKAILQKAGIIQAFMNKPESILLDDPLNRLDQAGIDEFIRFLHEYKSRFLKNNSIAVASDKLVYLWDVVDEIIFISNGEALARSTPDALKTKLSVYIIPQSQHEDFVRKNPEAVCRKTGKENVRIILTAGEAKKVQDIFLKKADTLSPEDVYHYYCGKSE